MDKKKNRPSDHKNKLLITAASIILIVLIGSYPAMSQTIEKIFKLTFADAGLIKAEDNNKITSIEKSVECNGINLTVKGAVSDGIRTVVSIRLDSKKVKFDGLQLNTHGVSLVDANGAKYEVSHYGQGESPKNKDSYETTIEFNGSPSKETTLKLNISEINQVKGNWILEFNVTPTPIKNYKVAGTYDDGKVKLSVSKVTATSTYTIIEGNLQPINFNFTSTLSNTNGDKFDMLSATAVKGGDIKFYYPPMTKTKDFTLTLTSPDGKNKILSMKINVLD